MAGSSQDKTEKPTSKRLGEARKKGNVAKSVDLSAVCTLMLGGFAAYLSASMIYGHFQTLIEELWGNGFSAALSDDIKNPLFLRFLGHYFLMIGPTAIVCVITAIGINMLQLKGIMISFEAIHPKFSKLNPATGLKRLFSLRSLTELAKSLLKLLIVGHAVYSIFRSEEALFLSLTDAELPDILRALGHLVVRVLVRVGMMMLVLGLLDYYYQKWSHIRDLKMTKQEVKEEMKQAEGSPQVKARIRQIQFSQARRRMMAAIPKATVVVTNPTHFAVALSYATGMEAPKVVAKGADFLALKIIEIARDSKVPVVRNPPLARALYHQVELEETIPLELYKAVAKVLAYIYRQKRQNTA